MAENGRSLAVIVEDEIDPTRDAGTVVYHFPVVIEVVSPDPPTAAPEHISGAVLNSITAALVS